MIAEAVRDLLNATAAVTDELGTFEFTTGAASAAIFTNRTIPPAATYPAVVIDEMGGRFAGTREKKGTNAFLRVRVYANNDETLMSLRDAAWAIYRTLDRSRLSALADDGYESVLTVADSPAALEDDKGFPGYLIGVRAEIIEA